MTKAYGNFSLEVAKLPEGSFFGELPLMLDITCYFQLNTGANKNEEEKMALVYEIDAEIFKEILADFPDFASSLYIRGEIRTAFFKHLAQLRQGEYSYNMKVVEVEKMVLKAGNFLSDSDVEDEIGKVTLQEKTF